MTTRGDIIAAAQRYWRRDKWNNEYFDAAGYADFVLASRAAEVQRLQMALADAEALELGTAEKCNQLRTELVKALAACKAKDEAILQESYSLALSFQPDDSALKAWLEAPVAWEFTDAFGTHYTDDQRDWMDTPGIESVTSLYSPKGLK